MNQQSVMKQMLRDAKRIVSIGYSFSKQDRHVRDAIEAIGNDRRARRLYCILKDDEENSKWEKTKNGIRDLWLIPDGIHDDDVFDGGGFDEKSPECVARFLNEAD